MYYDYLLTQRYSMHFWKRLPRVVSGVPGILYVWEHTDLDSVSCLGKVGREYPLVASRDYR